jgi:tetratricopeptide (TPR) repeat protein
MARGAVPQARQITARFREVGQAQIEEADRRKLLKLEARMNAWERREHERDRGVLEEIVKLDPLDGEALILLGQHYSGNNDPDRAIFYFERAASLDAFEARAKIHHAQVLAELRPLRRSPAAPAPRAGNPAARGRRALARARSSDSRNRVAEIAAGIYQS